MDLPTRVLYIKSITPELNIKLLETKGMKGKYCALSHCWGPKDKLPLQTFTYNQREHEKGIMPERLPRTFKEALMITKGIGIDYLWIDSLCIIQDSTDDWERESRVMGSLYEKATLMIAASDAPDSSKGCCSIVQRPEPKIVTMPFVDKRNRLLGQLHFSPVPVGECDPTKSLLNKRAWAFQERHMSRRKVFFMPGGITWSCKERMVDERNIESYLEIGRTARLPWLTILTDYSGMDLTKASDRLPAILGIAEELDKLDHNGHRGRYKFGVWDNSTSMPIDLFWRNDIPSSVIPTKALGIPSWSWAHIESEKIWYLYDFSSWVSKFEKTYTTLATTDTYSLAIHGYLGINNHSGAAGYYCTEDPISVEYSEFLRSLYDQATGFFESFSSFKPPIWILAHREASQDLGFVIFDDEKPRSNVAFSILALTTRDKAGPRYAARDAYIDSVSHY